MADNLYFKKIFNGWGIELRLKFFKKKKKDYHKSHNNCLLTNQISLKYLHLIWSQMKFYKSSLIYLKF